MDLNLQDLNRKGWKLLLEWGSIPQQEIFTVGNGESMQRMDMEYCRTRKLDIAIQVVGRMTKRTAMVARRL